MRRILTLSRDQRGSIALMIGLLMPLALMITGFALDYVACLRQKSHLQVAADAASMAAAKELTLIDYTKVDASSMALAIITASVAGNSTSLLKLGPVQANATTSTSPLQVTVTATQQIKTFFNVMGLSPSSLTVVSVAQVMGRPNICVLGLEPSSNDTIYMDKNAKLTGQNCAIYSNSSSNNGLHMKNNAVLTGSMICTAGGMTGAPRNYNPPPLTDCPIFDDPLKDRSEPASSPCDHTNLPAITNRTQTLQPGVYCGGLTIDGSSTVTLSSGIYVIRNGPLKITGTASVTGEFVGFFFTGGGATLLLDTNTTITPSGPKDGPMAGLLFFEGQQQNATTHTIRSENAHMLVGTLYFPASQLLVEATKPISDQSPYTAIVVKSLHVTSGPTLVLNTNYDQTPVPVPEGIKGVGQPVSLVQ